MSRHVAMLRVGPIAFRVGSAWKGPTDALRRLYAGYPVPAVPDFTVRLEPQKRWRRWIAPSVAIRGDYQFVGAAPLSLAHGLLAAEMGMNLQMALGLRRYLLLHASAVERDGRAVIMTGHSGAGKSTLAALLSERGWRFLGDEFVLVDLVTGQLRPFPRAVSLKNEAAAVMRAEGAGDRLLFSLDDTPKGRITYLRPDDAAIARMDETARPALILFPRFGDAQAVRLVGPAEVFVRLTQASTNYVTLGEPGFDALSALVRDLPARAIDYPDGDSAVALVERLWAELAR